MAAFGGGPWEGNGVKKVTVFLVFCVCFFLFGDARRSLFGFRRSASRFFFFCFPFPPHSTLCFTIIVISHVICSRCDFAIVANRSRCAFTMFFVVRRRL